MKIRSRKFPQLLLSSSPFTEFPSLVNPDMAKRTQLEIQVINDDEEEENSIAVIHSTASASGCFSPDKKSRRRINTGNTRKHGMLNSNQFSDCFEIIWKSFSVDRRASFTYLDCLWFSLYMDELHKGKVLAWIVREQIFLKKYVFVPIVHWGHWNLLIFCNFDEPLQSKTQTTCMLLLDSLQMSGPRRLEPMIRKFVQGIFEAEKRLVTKEVIAKIPLLVPKVPQQRNGEECGCYVLHFISLFMESAPEDFSISSGYPYFMKEDWFSPQDLDCFCKRLKPCTL